MVDIEEFHDATTLRLREDIITRISAAGDLRNTGDLEDSLAVKTELGGMPHTNVALVVSWSKLDQVRLVDRSEGWSVWINLVDACIRIGIGNDDRSHHVVVPSVDGIGRQ